MLDTEKIINQVLADGAALAENVGGDFLLAVTAAYMVGREAGKLASQTAA